MLESSAPHLTSGRGCCYRVVWQRALAWQTSMVGIQ